MKKAIITILAAAMLISFAGCGNSLSSQENEQEGAPFLYASGTVQNENGKDTDRIQEDMPDDTESASSAAEAAPSSTTSGADSFTEAPQPSHSQQPASPSSGSSKQKQTQAASPAGKPETQAPASQPSASQPPASMPDEPAPIPATPEPSTPPVPDPEPTPPPKPEFNISQWVQFGKDYGAQIGLMLDSSATACWDNPLTANARSLYLQEDIIDTLNSYKNDGFTHFWVWSEAQGGGSYLLYIGYA